MSLFQCSSYIKEYFVHNTNFVFAYVWFPPWRNQLYVNLGECRKYLNQDTHTQTHTPLLYTSCLSLPLYVPCYMCYEPYLFSSGVITSHPISDKPSLPLYSNPQLQPSHHPFPQTLRPFSNDSAPNLVYVYVFLSHLTHANLLCFCFYYIFILF